MKLLKPRCFILENVAGLKSVRSPGKPETMLDWANGKLREYLEEEYQWDHFTLDAYRLQLV